LKTASSQIQTSLELSELELSNSNPVDSDHSPASGTTEYSDFQNISRNPKRLELALSRDEMNLVEFPLAVLSTRANPKIKTLEFRDVQRLRTGQVIEKEWIITGADKFGLPTATDDDVILGLMRLSYENEFKDRKVYFSRYELLKTLRWSTEGRSYSRLAKSLDRLSGVRIRTKNGFFNNNDKAYQTRNFGIIDSYEINDSRGVKGSSFGKKPSYFVWGEILFNSFHANYIKKIDLDLYFGLKSSVSRRLYRYLDKHTYRSNRVEKPLLTLAFEKLGLSRSYKYVSSVKQQIEPACEELIKTGYLEGFEYIGKGSQTRIRFIRTPRGAANGAEHPLLQRTQERFSSNIIPSKTADKEAHLVAPIVKALASRGLSLTQAEKLLSNRKASELKHISQIIRYYDSLVATSDLKISRNPVGFLYRAIEKPENFAIPVDFEKSAMGSSAAGSGLTRPERVILGGKKNSSNNRAVLNKAVVNKQAYKATSSNLSGQSSSAEQSLYQNYQNYLSQEIERLRASLTPGQIQSAVLRSEEKMSCLKDIIEPIAYKDGLRKCIRAELAELLGLPDFHAWKE